MIRSRVARRAAGPFVTLATVVAIVAVRVVIPVPNPGVPLLLTVAFAAVLGGIAPALVSAGLMAAFVAVDASESGQLFTYSPDSLSRLAINLLAAPAMAILVGGVASRLQQEHAALTQARAAERERALMESATDAILTIDSASTIHGANPAAHELFGYPPGGLIGRSLTMLMPERLRPAHVAGLRAYLTTGRRAISWQGTELIARHSSGRELPVEVSFGEYGSGDDRRFTGIVRDVRRRHELEEQLRQAQKMEAVGRLAGGVAHDFNNILTAVYGFGEIARAELPPGHPSRDAIDEVLSAAGRAREVVAQLLAFGRRQVLRPVVVELNEVVTDVAPMLRRLIPENVEITTRLGARVPAIEVDRTQFAQVMLNLAVNARDAMPDGGALVIETGAVVLDEAYAADHARVTPGPHAMLAVSDTGVGMDAGTRSRIFEPFFTTKATGEGTGLGLATVYGIVEQSGGHILVYSEPGRGTTFKVYFPAVVGARNAPPPDDVEVPVQRGAGEHVLVAEDEEPIRRLVVATLQGLGYRVSTAETPEEALLLAERDAPRVLVTDVVMPGMSGIDLAAKVRAAHPVAVVYMSGYAPGAMPQHGGMPHGAIFVQKPFRSDDLGRAVARALASTAQR